MSHDSIEKVLEEIGRSCPMVLSTEEDGNVYSRMMSIIYLDGLFYFQTDRNFKKCRQLEKNPKAALSYENTNLRGMCKELGHPLENTSFIEEFRKRYPGSFSRYSRLENEVLFSFKPLSIARWLYEDGISYIESTDLEKMEYSKTPYL